MNTEQPSLSSGTIIVAIRLPDRWPVPAPAIMLETALTDGAIVIGCLPTGQFEAGSFKAATGELLHSVTSPIVKVAPAQPLVLLVTWEDGKILEFELDKVSLLADVDEIEIKPSGPLETPLPDFAERNERVRNQRRSVAMNQPVNPRRKQGGEEYMFASLQGEIEQIEDLVSAIKRGRDAHVPGLASRLRLLVSGKPMGLLQHCAAFKNEPLILYTDRQPEILPPVKGGFGILGTGQAEPSQSNPCPVDLDVWLKFPAIKVGEDVYSHLDAIKEIGDTMGAHRDAGIPQSVQALQFTRTQNSRTYRDVQRYLLEITEPILALCRSLLSRSDRSQSDAAPKG